MLREKEIKNTLSDTKGVSFRKEKLVMAPSCEFEVSSTVKAYSPKNKTKSSSSPKSAEVSLAITKLCVPKVNLFLVNGVNPRFGIVAFDT